MKAKAIVISLAVLSATCFSISSCTSKKRDPETCTKLLESIYLGNANIFEESWIKAHCSAKMQQTLIDAYDYELEPGQVAYGSWIIGGWEAGEDGTTVFKDITHDDKYYYANFIANPEYANYCQGERVIRFTMKFDGDTPVIDDCEWIKNISYIDQ